MSPGMPVEVTFPGEDPWVGKVARARETRTRLGVSWLLTIVVSSGRLDTEPVSRFYAQKSCSETDRKESSQKLG